MGSQKKSRFEGTGNLLKACPLCSETYHVRDIAIIERAADAQVIHLTCSSCTYNLIATIVTSDIGVGTVAMLTDLSAAEAHKYYRRPPVDEDAILGLHALLTKKEEQFIHLFS